MQCSFKLRDRERVSRIRMVCSRVWVRIGWRLGDELIAIARRVQYNSCQKGPRRSKSHWSENLVITRSCEQKRSDSYSSSDVSSCDVNEAGLSMVVARENHNLDLYLLSRSVQLDSSLRQYTKPSQSPHERKCMTMQWTSIRLVSSQCSISYATGCTPRSHLSRLIQRSRWRVYIHTHGMCISLCMQIKTYARTYAYVQTRK